MERRDLNRKPVGQVELDICYACQAIWFDQYESAQLTPGSILDLFKLIHEHEPRGDRHLPDVLKCPGCRKPLVFTQDIQRTNRINYYRCPSGEGRLTTFLQFLREKNFVRSLSKGEIDQLRVSVAQVRCTACGAPVDLARDPACGFCRAPISILDADAVSRTVAELGAAERRTTQIDPDRMLKAVLAGKGYDGKGPRAGGRSSAASGVVDLVNDALHILMSD